MQQLSATTMFIKTWNRFLIFQPPLDASHPGKICMIEDVHLLELYGHFVVGCECLNHNGSTLKDSCRYSPKKSKQPLRFGIFPLRNRVCFTMLICHKKPKWFCQEYPYDCLSENDEGSLVTLSKLIPYTALIMIIQCWSKVLHINFMDFRWLPLGEGANFYVTAHCRERHLGWWDTLTC